MYPMRVTLQFFADNSSMNTLSKTIRALTEIWVE